MALRGRLRSGDSKMNGGAKVRDVTLDKGMFVCSGRSLDLQFD